MIFRGISFRMCITYIARVTLITLSTNFIRGKGVRLITLIPYITRLILLRTNVTEEKGGWDHNAYNVRNTYNSKNIEQSRKKGEALNAHDINKALITLNRAYRRRRGKTYHVSSYNLHSGSYVCRLCYTRYDPHLFLLLSYSVRYTCYAYYSHYEPNQAQRLSLV